MTRLRCAILDDYFKLSLTSADWSKITDRVDLTVFEKPFGCLDTACDSRCARAAIELHPNQPR